jgi:hypothetical protein
VLITAIDATAARQTSRTSSQQRSQRTATVEHGAPAVRAERSERSDRAERPDRTRHSAGPGHRSHSRGQSNGGSPAARGSSSTRSQEGQRSERPRESGRDNRRQPDVHPEAQRLAETLVQLGVNLEGRSEEEIEEIMLLEAIKQSMAANGESLAAIEAHAAVSPQRSRVLQAASDSVGTRHSPFDDFDDDEELARAIELSLQESHVLSTNSDDMLRSSAFGSAPSLAESSNPFASLLDRRFEDAPANPFLQIEPMLTPDDLDALQSHIPASAASVQDQSEPALVAIGHQDTASLPFDGSNDAASSTQASEQQVGANEQVEEPNPNLLELLPL